MASPRRETKASELRGAVSVENTGQHFDSLGDPLPILAWQAVEQKRRGGGPFSRHRLCRTLAAWGQAHVCLTTVVSASSSHDVSATLEPGKIAAGGRWVDAEDKGERRCGHGAAIGNELKRLGLLRRDIAGARPRPTEPAQGTGQHLERSCNLEVAHAGSHTDRQGAARRQAARLGWLGWLTLGTDGGDGTNGADGAHGAYRGSQLAIATGRGIARGSRAL
jgi:hypothetical protein